MRRTTAGVLILGIAGGLNLAWNRQDPPHTIEPLPLPGTEPRERKPTAIVFGHDDGVYVRRPPTVGSAQHLVEIESGEEFGTIRLMGIRIGAYGGDDPPVTMEEYGAWLAAGSPEDVDTFLAELRGE